MENFDIKFMIFRKELDSRETKIIDFKSNCLCKSIPKFGLKMNNSWSNVKLKGQLLMKFYESDIHGKLME